MIIEEFVDCDGCGGDVEEVVVAGCCCGGDEGERVWVVWGAP